MMTNKHKKVPELRFKGFTDDWEQRKLIEVADYRNGKAHEKDISEDGDYIVVNSKFVSTNGLVKKYSDEMIAPLSKGEIAFVLSDVPNGRAIARTFLINEDNKYSLNQRIAGITPHADTNSYFLHSLMNRHHFFLRFDDGVSQTNLSKKDVEKWTEFYPSYDEQQKIGSLFKLLDEIVALHQRKLDLLKEQKKGFLQKMFPKNGEIVPELRFEEFAEAWEQVKLREVVEQQIKGKAQFDKLKFGTVEYLDASRLNGGVPVLTNEIKDVYTNDVLILWDGSKAGTVYTGFEGVLGSTLKAYRTSADSQFVYQFLKRHQENIYNNYRTPNIPHVQKDFLEVFKISVPHYDEQVKIGNFFYTLDTQITIYQRKLDLLKEQKKGFLQKIFV